MKGHLRERSAGHWAIVLDRQDPMTGRRKRRWHSFTGTKRQAQIRCAELVAEQQSGTSVDPSKITVVEFLDRFDRDWAALHVSVRSRDRYRFALDHVRRHLGDRMLQKVHSVDIAALYASLTREGLAPRTIRMVHTALHRALGQAKNWGILRDNPADSAKPPKAPDQEIALLERLRGQPLFLIALLALGAGLRRMKRSVYDGGMLNSMVGSSRSSSPWNRQPPMGSGLKAQRPSAAAEPSRCRRTL